MSKIIKLFNFMMILPALFLFSCVSTGTKGTSSSFSPPSYMSREYSGIDKAKLLKACEEALRASDNDYKISERSESSFSAERRWVFVAVIFNETGKSFWKINIEDKGEKYLLSARSWSSAKGRSIPPFPVNITAGNNEHQPYSSQALYKLFFGRVDYALSLRQEWPSCKDAKSDLKPKESAAELESLCTYADSGAAQRL